LANKLNIEEIKLLIPDYITGSLNEEESALVDNAIKSNPEIESLYSDMKNAFDFVEKVKFDEPVPQYWNNLLPKIHEKIEERSEKKFFKNPIPLIWKILVPVTAILLFAVIYRIATTPEKQITKENIPNIQKEKPPEQQNPVAEQKTLEDSLTNNQSPDNKEPVLKRRYPHNKVESRKPDENESLANKDNEPAEQKENAFLELLSSDDVSDLSELNSVEANTPEEELDNEIQKLNNSEKEAFLQELENTNL
jgi:hypothetical protein